jgi:hypothetical protein
MTAFLRIDGSARRRKGEKNEKIVCIPDVENVRT